jgi:hypothetical protein
MPALPASKSKKEKRAFWESYSSAVYWEDLEEGQDTFKRANDLRISVIQETLTRADSPQARFFDHGSVIDWLQSWGSENKGQPPE